MEIIPGRNHSYSNFNQRVHEEEHRSRIIDDVFRFSSEENPHRKKVEYNTLLCAAIKEENRLELLKQKQEQANFLNDRELRDLGVKMRAAYVSKALAAQKFEKLALAKQVKLFKHQNYIVALRQARLNVKESNEKYEESQRLKKAALKRDLLEQMAENEAKREQVRQSVIRDKQLLDETKRKYDDDLRREAEEELKRKKRSMRDLDEFLQLQNSLKLKLNQADRAADDRMLEMKRKFDLAQAKAAQEKKAKLDHRIEMSEEIGRRTFQARMEKEKSMDHLIDLLVDEKNAKAIRQDYLKELQKKEDVAATRRQMHRGEEERERRKLDEQREKVAYYQKYLDLLAEHDRVQGINDGLRRNKIEDNRVSLHKAFDHKKELRAIDMKRNIMIDKFDKEEMKRKSAAIEVTRQNMLRAHVPKLIGFLHPRMLTVSDRQFIAQL